MSTVGRSVMRSVWSRTEGQSLTWTPSTGDQPDYEVDVDAVGDRSTAPSCDSCIAVVLAFLHLQYSKNAKGATGQ